MAKDEMRAALRSLPSVDRVLQSSEARHWVDVVSRETLAQMVRGEVESLRQRILDGFPVRQGDLMDQVTERVGQAVLSVSRSSLRPVINATGVILHTNLGRAPLGNEAIREITNVARGYSNLEYDLAERFRGQRDMHCRDLLRHLLGAEAIVVNNNAAAILLVLHELAADGEVVVSRGELVEIGDGFRILDILEASGARVKEVGATNRTRAEDYMLGIGPETKALLRIHPSNFKQVGFTGRASLYDLVRIAESASIPLIEDLGSGCLVNLAQDGIKDEPPVAHSLMHGVDIVTFSGDKLLGGPQAGIIAGRAELVNRMRRNPLFRALRVDKLTLAALSATLREYLAGAEEQNVPVIGLMRMSPERLEARAALFAKRLAILNVPHASVIKGKSLLGGGSTPMEGLESSLVAIRRPEGLGPDQIADALLASDPPVVARIEVDRVLLDLRTVFEDQEDALLAAVLRACRYGRQD